MGHSAARAPLLLSIHGKADIEHTEGSPERTMMAPPRDPCKPQEKPPQNFLASLLGHPNTTGKSPAAKHTDHQKQSGQQAKGGALGLPSVLLLSRLKPKM